MDKYGVQTTTINPVPEKRKPRKEEKLRLLYNV